MTVKDAIISIIRENTYVSVPITEESNLYTDLGFNSLSFISVLAEIEDVYNITIGITEMEICLQVNRLVATVESRIKESGSKND